MCQRLNCKVNFGQQFSSIVRAVALMFDDTFIKDSDGPGHCMIFRKETLQIEFWEMVVPKP